MEAPMGGSASGAYGCGSSVGSGTHGSGLRGGSFGFCLGNAVDFDGILVLAGGEHHTHKKWANAQELTMKFHNQSGI